MYKDVLCDNFFFIEYGFTRDGRIIINPNVTLNLNIEGEIPIHEYDFGKDAFIIISPER